MVDKHAAAGLPAMSRVSGPRYMTSTPFETAPLQARYRSGQWPVAQGAAETWFTAGSLQKWWPAQKHGSTLVTRQKSGLPCRPVHAGLHHFQQPQSQSPCARSDCLPGVLAQLPAS